jgi:hypothetical protein
MGTSFYFVVLLLAANLLLWILTKITNFCAPNKLIEASLHRIWKIITPSLFIRTFIEINSNTLISCIIQVLVVKSTKTWADYLSTILSVALGILQIIFPFIFAKIIWKFKSRKILHLKETKRKYGELYHDFFRCNNTSIVLLFY